MSLGIENLKKLSEYGFYLDDYHCIANAVKRINLCQHCNNHVYLTFYKNGVIELTDSRGHDITNLITEYCKKEVGSLEDCQEVIDFIEKTKLNF